MNKVFKIVIVPLLFIIEYAFKFLAGVGAAIVLAAEGSFFGKISAGFRSVIPTLQQLFNAPANLSYISTVIEDYNTLTASTFNQRYGGQAINNVLEQLNEGVAYLQAIYQNVMNQPISTICATLVIFFCLYLVGWSSRFLRQKGQGSVVNRFERRLGKRVFQNDNQMQK